jgi:DNA end-binding protein Ku
VPRALWSGSLSFGLVNVPVQLVSAARDVDYHFHQLHRTDNVPVEQRRICSRENVEGGGRTSPTATSSTASR